MASAVDESFVSDVTLVTIYQSHKSCSKNGRYITQPCNSASRYLLSLNCFSENIFLRQNHRCTFQNFSKA